jgi:hypothetical protein
LQKSRIYITIRWMFIKKPYVRTNLLLCHSLSRRQNTCSKHSRHECYSCIYHELSKPRDANNKNFTSSGNGEKLYMPEKLL